MDLKYHNITISGKIAVGTTTLAKNLQKELGWKYYNTGAMQREFDRAQGRNENAIGAESRTDDHEREMEAMTKKVLTHDKNIIYEAWLSGFVAQGIPDVLKVLVICSEYAVRVDRVVNREKITVDEAKAWMKQREEENIPTWQRLYGDHDFWDPKYYDIVIDTYRTGPMESVGAVLDKLGYKK
ncbi:cytidylate kinase family protein [Candidatus Microgenomates bacterium]|nr:cytidylate kinase family protein [Candidatus Microgenomates bacterium]